MQLIQQHLHEVKDTAEESLYRCLRISYPSTPALAKEIEQGNPTALKSVIEVCLNEQQVTSLDLYTLDPIPNVQRFKLTSRWPSITTEQQCLPLVFINKHYYLAILGTNRLPLILDWARCRSCSKWFKHTSKTGQAHFISCVRCEICARPKREGREHACYGPVNMELVRSRARQQHARSNAHDLKFKTSEPLDIDWNARHDVWLADFETFESVSTRHVFKVYAVGYAACTSEPPTIAYGPGALDHFMSKVMSFNTSKALTIYFWNGSAFDILPILRWLQRKKIVVQPGNLIKKGKRIIMCTIDNSADVTVCFKDMFLMVPESLASACKSFGVPDELAKSDFDHSKIRDWKSADEHKEELIKYLRNDILALRTIVQLFGTQVATQFNLDFSEYLTISHLTVNAWRTSYDPECSIVVPSVDDHDAWHSAVRGGRVIPQVKYWAGRDSFSTPYAQLTDYCRMFDCNSLYPFSMINEFPTGPYEIIDYADEPPHAAADFILAFNTPREDRGAKARGDDDRCYWSMWEVDVACPGNLLTPYLPSRSLAGEIEYTLLPKVREKYCGFELLHAISLGYKITHIYSEWFFYENKPLTVFKEYILKCYQGRLANPAPHVLNALFKLLMNALYGKMAQNLLDEEVGLYPVEKERLLEEDPRAVVDTEVVIDEFGDVLSYIVTFLRDEVSTSYPFYLGAYILAYSRTIMSNALLAVNGYTIASQAMHYTDTDSLILSPRSSLLFPQSMQGNALGLFKDDLKGQGRIIRAVYLAPKTYCLVYRSEDNKVWLKVRCKGIPHENAPILITSERDLLWPHDEALAAKLDTIQESRTSTSVATPYVNVTFRAYELKHLNGSRLVSKHLSYQAFLWMAESKLEYIACTYGSMKVVYASGSGQGFGVMPRYEQRRLSSLDTSWWAKGKRTWNEELGISVPLGFNDE